MEKKQAQPVDDVGELEQYIIELRLMYTGRIISWWINTAQSSQFSILSDMAIDIFSILAMSFEAERLFSGTK